MSWVHGTKQKFFECRKEEWLREAEENRAGPFYTKMAKLFLLKYGYRLADNEDLAQDVPDPSDEAANTVVHKVLERGEAEFRDQYQKNLRNVRARSQDQ